MSSFLNLINEIQEWHASYYHTQDDPLGLGVAAHLINNKRSRIIAESYKRDRQLNPEWYQDMGPYDSSKVDLSNELGTIIEPECCDLAMVTIPKLVSIKNEIQRVKDLGIIHVRSTCGTFYHKSTRMKLITMASTGDKRAKMGLYFREGNRVYCYPHKDKINPMLILHDPRDGFVINPSNVINGELLYGEGYTVEDGLINYNTGSGVKPLQRGDTFTATSTGGLSWTGSGKVRFTNVKRAFRYTDSYPIDGEAWKNIKDLIIADFMNAGRNMADAQHDGAPEEALQKSRE